MGYLGGTKHSHRLLYQHDTQRWGWQPLLVEEMQRYVVFKILSAVALQSVLIRRYLFQRKRRNVNSMARCSFCHFQLKGNTSSILSINYGHTSHTQAFHVNNICFCMAFGRSNRSTKKRRNVLIVKSSRARSWTNLGYTIDSTQRSQGAWCWWHESANDSSRIRFGKGRIPGKMWVELLGRYQRVETRTWCFHSQE